MGCGSQWQPYRAIVHLGRFFGCVKISPNKQDSKDAKIQEFLIMTDGAVTVTEHDTSRTSLITTLEIMTRP
jgi:hypothetical protein